MAFQDTQAALNSPLAGGGADFSALNNYYGSKASQPLTAIGTNAMLTQNAADYAYKQQADAIARANAIADAKTKIATLQAQADPKNFQQVKNKSGGYAFFDGAGNPISLGDYVKATGADMGKILADSTDPRDQQFVKDYSQLEGLLQASAKGTDAYNKALDAIDKESPGAKAVLQTMKPADLLKQFNQTYSVYTGYGNDLPNARPDVPAVTDGFLGIGNKPAYTPTLYQQIAGKL